MLFLLFLHRRFRREKRRPHRSGPSFLLWNPRGRSPLVEPPLPVPFPRRPTPYVGFAVAPSPQGGTFTAESPLADRRCRFAVAPARCRCQLITTGWSASAGSPRHLYLSLSLSLRAIPRGPPPLVGPVRRGSDPANSYVSLSLSLSLSLSPCDSPWPTAAGRASSPWLRPRKQGSSGGPSVSGPLPQRSPVADRRPRFRFASAILILDSRSRNLKPKPQALNRKKKSPPPAV
jgi:hypothetical protein